MSEEVRKTVGVPNLPFLVSHGPGFKPSSSTCVALGKLLSLGSSSVD